MKKMYLFIILFILFSAIIISTKNEDNILNDSFVLPKSSDLCNSAINYDSVIRTGTSASNTSDGNVVSLSQSNATAYYYFDKASSVFAENDYNNTFLLKKIFIGLDEIPEKFYMEYTATAGDNKISITLNLDNASSIDENNLMVTWDAPYFYNTGYNNNIVIEEYGDVVGYENYLTSSSSGTINNKTINFTLGSMFSGGTRTITNYYKKNQIISSEYIVKWYDANTLEEIKLPETRSSNIGEEVRVKESDKEISGYIFDENNKENILNIELESSGTILRLYFTKIGDTEGPEKPDIPENPDIPEKPDNPDTPNDSTTPDKPEDEKNPITSDNIIYVSLTLIISSISFMLLIHNKNKLLR